MSGYEQGRAVHIDHHLTNVAINYRRDREAAERTAEEARTVGRRAIAMGTEDGPLELWLTSSFALASRIARRSARSGRR